MKKRRLFLPLLLLMMLMLSVSAHAETYDKNMTAKGSDRYFVDGQEYSYGDVVYHRFTLKKPALVKMYGASFSNGERESDNMGGSYAICNGKKAQIFAITTYAQRTDGKTYGYFFLNAGTYYVKATVGAPYQMNLKYNYCTRKFATSKKKARGLSKGKAVVDYFLKGEKQSHWYKVTLKKAQKDMKIWFCGRGEGTLLVNTTFSGKKKTAFRALRIRNGEGVVTYYNSLGKLPKGTYYFQVKLYDKSQPNAYYSMKWK